MRQINLAGPEGNAFAVAGLSASWSRQLGETPTNILTLAGSYNDVLDAFDALWKDRIDYQFLNDPRDPDSRDSWEDTEEEDEDE